MAENILSYINILLTTFNAYASKNQVIAGVVSLWGLASLSYLMRNIPIGAWNIFLKHSTTSMILISTHESYHNFLKWLELNGYLKNIRNIKISSGRWGDDKLALKSIGYGNHYFFYKFRVFKLSMHKLDTDSNSSMEKDEIKITIFGRSHSFFNKISEEIERIDALKGRLSVYRYSRHDCWNSVGGNQYKRNIDTIFLKKNVKENILEYLNRFNDSEQWHIDNGISYQTGILLYGPPGTGKTSLIKALASELNKPIYILSASKLSSIEGALLGLPEKSILLIEDIDKERITNEESTEPNSDKKTIKQVLFSFANLSDILNSIDGIISSHGRILIATTNHKDRLAKALLRNGRFDLKLELGYADKYVLKMFFNRYYPDFDIPKGFDINDNISAATIQALILNNLNSPAAVLSNIKKQ